MEHRRPAPRASDQEREAVVERLREAAADGRLDMAEFHERMASAYAARTRPELAPLLADLGNVPDPAPAAPTNGRIGALLSSRTCTGSWQVPQQLEVSLLLASARLDLTTTQIPDHVRMHLGIVLSSVEVVVPPGVRVQTDSVRSVLSSVNDRARPAQPPVATLTLSGYATLSSVTVKTPNALTQWWRDVTTGGS